MDFKDKQGLSLLFMRVLVAAIFLWHGIPKAFDFSMAMGKFAGMGFPGFLGPVVGWAEVIAGVLLLVGFWHKYANYVLGIIIVVAILGVQIGKGVTAGLERDLLILAGILVLLAAGPGSCTVSK
jgi:putative oxidoreductase